MTKSLEVRSHVGRDLLQSAQVFKTDRAVVWEYVANSLQYTDPGVSPRVVVAIDEMARTTTIGDNGRGMDLDDLAHFFTMRGENLERAAGRIGRGMFGTGKSAAFGIGTTLTISSVKDGKRTKVRLDRADVETMTDGTPVPVQILESEVATGEPNGTVVEIGGIHLRRIDRQGVVTYIERHLAHYPRDVEVYVDHHRCEFIEPEVSEEKRYRTTPEEATILGDIELILKVSKAALTDELQGIQVFSHGNWHTTTLVGSEGKNMAEYIFGEIEIPALEEDQGPIAPFDNTRSGQLNPANEVVAALYRFIGPKVDSVRRDLVARERERARSEEAKRLAEQAAQIAEVLSEDFADFQAQLRAVKSAAAGRDLGKRYEGVGEDPDSDTMTEGGDVIATPAGDDEERQPTSDPEPGSTPPPDLPDPVTAEPDGTTTGQPRAGQDGTRRAPRGGLRIEYKNMGESESRGRYRTEVRTILINLDHPQVSAAYKIGGPEAPEFIRLTAEIATSEYAIALASELVDTYTVADEAIFDIHTAIDRVSRKFVGLYGEK